MDSPFCRPCWDKGKVGQTYRLSGQPNFRCHDCKTIYHESFFDKWELQWKSEPMKWHEGMRAKKLGESASKVYKEQSERLGKLK